MYPRVTAVRTFMHTCNAMNSRVVVRGGGNLTKRRPVFTKDGKFLLVCSGPQVKIVSCASGECVRELKGHRSNVTGVQVSPWNKLQVLTSSEDGTVILWDYMDNAILKTIKFDRPLHGLFVHEAHKNLVFVICRKLDDDGKVQSKKSWMLCTAPIPAAPSNTNPVTLNYITPVGLNGDKGVSFGVNGEYVACLMGSTLKIYTFRDSTLQKIIMDGPRPTCVACHPNDYCVAVGDVKGQISMVWNLQQADGAVQAVDHWHALPVGDLCFSPEGTFLLSGGHECTLVQWQYNSKHKGFMPRLGAAITHIASSPDGQTRALALKSNAILLIANNKVLHTVQGLDHSSFQQSEPVPAGLSVDPRTGALVLNGRVGHLQFYQLKDDKLLYNLDITGENYISPENLDKPLTHTEITHVTFDPRGQWMVTSERRDDGETSVEMRLRFWEFDDKKQSFSLNTTIESPHTDVINTLVFRPAPTDGSFDDPMAVTTSKDGQLKIWALVDDTDIEKSRHCWNCDSVGFYKNIEPSAAAFSSDGSLLAVGFHDVPTLWDPETNQLRQVLAHTAVDGQIRCLCFGHTGSSHLLVCSTASSLTVWNLLTCRVLWNVTLAVARLIGDPYTEHFAVFDDKQNLYVFHGSKPHPVFHHVCASSSPIVSAAFTPGKTASEGDLSKDALPWQPASDLYFLTKSQELLTVISGEQAEREESVNKYDMTDLHASLPETPFAQLLGEYSLPSSASGQGTGQATKPLSTATTKEILAAPPHILPPASHLCGAFILSLLGTAAQSHRTSHWDSDSDDDDSDAEKPDRASSDSDMETDTLAPPPGKTMAQSQASVETNEAAVELSDKEMKLVEKAARTGFGWLEEAISPASNQTN